MIHPGSGGRGAACVWFWVLCSHCVYLALNTGPSLTGPAKAHPIVFGIKVVFMFSSASERSHVGKCCISLRTEKRKKKETYLCQMFLILPAFDFLLGCGWFLLNIWYKICPVLTQGEALIMCGQAAEQIWLPAVFGLIYFHIWMCNNECWRLALYPLLFLSSNQQAALCFISYWPAEAIPVVSGPGFVVYACGWTFVWICVISVR